MEPLQLEASLVLPEGEECPHCLRRLQEALHAHKGVSQASIVAHEGRSRLRLEYDPLLISPRQVEEEVRRAGLDLAERYGHLHLSIEGLDCADCAQTLEEGVRRLPGVLHATVGLLAGTLSAEFDRREVTREQILRRVGELGYRVSEVVERHPRRVEAGLLAFLRRTEIARWAAGSLCFLLAGALLSLFALPAWVPRAAYAAAILIGGIPVARAGWASLRITRSLDINILMTLAGLGAMAVGEWSEGAVAMFLFALGEALERYSMDRARRAIGGLIDLSPEVAARLVDGREERVPLEVLQVGDQLRVRPGERIPVDGEIVEGSSGVDQAAITGESIPVAKVPGDAVYAGTLNGEGLLLVRVARRAQESTLARIIAMVEEAQGRKAPAQRFVDRFARFYTPAVVAVAVLVSILPPLLTDAPFAEWFYRALVLLVIACPCALVLSTPVSIASAIAAAARAGVLVKGGVYMEALGSLKALALDKTGTLTEGRPAVTNVIPYSDRGAEEVLLAAAAVEAGSTHPLAQAVLHEARRRGIESSQAEECQSFSGRGASGVVAGQRVYVGSHTFFEAWGGHPAAVCTEIDALEAAGQTAILVGTESEVWGVLALADQLRPQTQAAVAELRRSGVEHVVMLTGDNRPTAEAVARAAGVDDVRANLLPEQKVDAVEALLRRFGQVGMVGDGVNDAPALARATVGIAMGVMGSDAALETADVALMGDDLARLPWIVRLGRQTRRTISQNVALSLVLKGIFLGLAVAGWATLWMAVFADMGASLLVTFNGLRLLWTGGGTPSP